MTEILVPAAIPTSVSKSRALIHHFAIWGLIVGLLGFAGLMMFWSTFDQRRPVWAEGPAEVDAGAIAEGDALTFPRTICTSVRAGLQGVFRRRLHDATAIEADPRHLDHSSSISDAIGHALPWGPPGADPAQFSTVQAHRRDGRCWSGELSLTGGVTLGLPHGHRLWFDAEYVGHRNPLSDFIAPMPKVFFTISDTPSAGLNDAKRQ